jgi:hypothetical protein
MAGGAELSTDERKSWLKVAATKNLTSLDVMNMRKTKFSKSLWQLVAMQRRKNTAKLRAEGLAQSTVAMMSAGSSVPVYSGIRKLTRTSVRHTRFRESKQQK